MKPDSYCRDCEYPIMFAVDQSRDGKTVPVEPIPIQMIAPRDDVPVGARKLRQRRYVPTLKGFPNVQRRTVYPLDAGVDGRYVDTYIDHRSVCKER